ncbi:MAG: hypothetical protein K6F87_03355 [Lachnospiraceae bacterium]|nr:hypothetical protein [Lachnospiraceae bacterium]
MLKRTDEGIVSNDGKVLNRVDKAILLPTPADPLNEEAFFPGDFGNISVKYPEQMTVEAREDVKNSLTFKPAVGYGTRDEYSDIMLKFMPITADYDKFLGHGYEVSKEAMRILLNKCFDRMYGPYLLKSLGTDFVDCGDYFSITGYMLLDGKMFTVDSEEPVRGRMEVRYYGPIGYVLTITTIAYEDRLENYCGICDNIMSTCSILSSYSTSPKAVPDKPGTAVEKTDGGFFWVDSDGDKWFWNGARNIFVTFHKEVVIKKSKGNKAAAYRDRSNPWSDPPENNLEILLNMVDAYSEDFDQEGTYEELMTVIDEW